MTVEWTMVDSSNVAAIGYDKEAEELHVQFNNGSTYVYRAVPEDVVKDFLNADSKGKFLNEHIKGVYSYERIS